MIFGNNSDFILNEAEFLSHRICSFASLFAGYQQPPFYFRVLTESIHCSFYLLSNSKPEMVGFMLNLQYLTSTHKIVYFSYF